MTRKPNRREAIVALGAALAAPSVVRAGAAPAPVVAPFSDGGSLIITETYGLEWGPGPKTNTFGPDTMMSGKEHQAVKSALFYGELDAEFDPAWHNLQWSAAWGIGDYDFLELLISGHFGMHELPGYGWDSKLVATCNFYRGGTPVSLKKLSFITGNFPGVPYMISKCRYKVLDG